MRVHVAWAVCRAITEPSVRRHLANASGGVAHTAALATYPEDLAAALDDQLSDWLYLRYQVHSESQHLSLVTGSRMIDDL
jgi:hypothetical protein